MTLLTKIKVSLSMKSYNDKEWTTTSPYKSARTILVQLIIKMKALLVLFTTTLFVHTKADCPVGYVSLPGSNNGMCYKAVFTYSTWFNAEQTCFNSNGHLASVDSAFLNMWITSLVKNSTLGATEYWLGGYWNKFDSKWAWADFNNVTYDNWQPGK